MNTTNTAQGSGAMKRTLNPRIKPAFGKADPVGTEITGRIVRIDEEQDRDWVTRAPVFLTDGVIPKTTPILILQTDGTARTVGPGLRKLYRRTGVRDALIEALDTAGITEPQVDGIVWMKFAALGDPPAENFSAPKLFDATYEPSIDQAA